MIKESTKIPNNIEDIAAFQGGFLSENGNKKITGQHGVIPFILSQSGDIIIKEDKQIIAKYINNLLLFLAIIFSRLEPNL